jgi:hypothetical protein
MIHVIRFQESMLYLIICAITRKSSVAPPESCLLSDKKKMFTLNSFTLQNQCILTSRLRLVYLMVLVKQLRAKQLRAKIFCVESKHLDIC